ncbi:MAG: VOC family protein [Saprospiraceae bacterium]|nr:VOC family protein [Saprospiraceae bacterium]
MLGLRTSAYMVKDLEGAKNWYAKAFMVDPYFDQPFYVGFNIGGYELGLIPQEDQEIEVGNNNITYWGVNDIETTFQYFLDLGAQIHEAPHNVGDEIMVASVIDPWGNIIGIIYNPHFCISV